MSDTQRAEFQPVAFDDALKLFREAEKTVASTLLWTKDDTPEIKVNFTIFNEVEKTFLCWVPTGFDVEAFSEKHATAGNGGLDCFFSVSLTGANIFFKANFKGYNETSLIFSLPEKVFKVQRRQNMRFPIPDGYLIKVEFVDPLYSSEKQTRKIYDISATGMSFVVDSMEDVIYQVGLAIKAMTFTVKNRSITVDGEVRHSAALPPSSRMKGIKVGVEFKGIRPGDSQHIAVYVFDEGRKYFSKFF